MNGFCNTTAGDFPIFRDLIMVGHDHEGFFGPIAVTGEIICKCGLLRLTRPELTALAELAASAPEKAA